MAIFDYEKPPHPDAHKSFIVVYFNDDGETSMHRFGYAELVENLQTEYWGEAKVHTKLPNGGDGGRLASTDDVGIYIMGEDGELLDPKKREWPL
jgi:hypothetical protein